MYQNNFFIFKKLFLTLMHQNNPKLFFNKKIKFLARHVYTDCLVLEDDDVVTCR
jgi:hypothetical protein